jgi:hypothetical protein
MSTSSTQFSQNQVCIEAVGRKRNLLVQADLISSCYRRYLHKFVRVRVRLLKVTPLSLSSPNRDTSNNFLFAVCYCSDAQHHVLLLTGWDETFLKYAEVIRKLLESHCSVYTMDHRGLGLSGRTIPDEQVYDSGTSSHFGTLYSQLLDMLTGQSKYNVHASLKAYTICQLTHQNLCFSDIDHCPGDICREL